jgi:hypothetical protein
LRTRTTVAEAGQSISETAKQPPEVFAGEAGFETDQAGQIISEMWTFLSLEIFFARGE